MKALTHIVLLLLLGLSVQAQLFQETNLASTFRASSPNRALISQHRTVAILPPDILLPPVSIRNTGEMYLSEADSAVALQETIYEKLVQRNKKGAVNYLPVRETNQRLQASNIDLSMISKYQPGDLAKLLNVDAVLTVRTDERAALPKSDAVLAMFSPHSSRGTDISDIMRAKVEIWDAERNEQVWYFSSTQRLSPMNSKKNRQHLWIRRMARAIPYRK